MRTPRVKFLDCTIYMVEEGGKRIGVLVEKPLDNRRYTKWNSNNGSIKSQKEAVVQDRATPQIPCDSPAIDPRDIPQAFSHFTHRYT